jgi:hypothetical protein
MSQLEIPLENAARQKFEPMAKHLQEELEGIVEKRNEEIVDELGGKLKDVANAVAAIREQLIMDDEEVQ